MRIANLMLAGAMAAVLVACGSEDPVANQPSNIVGTIDNAEIETLPADEGGTAEGVDDAETTEGPIPAALQGRWGMTPQDCTSTRGDAKGLVTVSRDRLRFYESTARPSPDVETTADSLSGNFDFSGEGQTWSQHQVFEVRDGKLVRTNSDPMASYTYVRCR